MPMSFSHAAGDEGLRQTSQARAMIQIQPIMNNANDKLRFTRLLMFILFSVYSFIY